MEKHILLGNTKNTNIELVNFFQDLMLRRKKNKKEFNLLNTISAGAKGCFDKKFTQKISEKYSSMIEHDSCLCDSFVYVYLCPNKKFAL